MGQVTFLGKKRKKKKERKKERKYHRPSGIIVLRAIRHTFYSLLWIQMEHLKRLFHRVTAIFLTTLNYFSSM